MLMRVTRFSLAIALATSGLMAMTGAWTEAQAAAVHAPWPGLNSPAETDPLVQVRAGGHGGGGRGFSHGGGRSFGHVGGGVRHFGGGHRGYGYGFGAWPWIAAPAFGYGYYDYDDDCRAVRVRERRCWADDDGDRRCGHRWVIRRYCD